MYWNTQNQSSKPSFTKQSQHSQGLLGIDMILKIKFQMCASSLVCINDACCVKATMQSKFRWERYCWSNEAGQFSLLLNINQFVYLLALLRRQSNPLSWRLCSLTVHGLIIHSANVWRTRGPSSMCPLLSSLSERNLMECVKECRKLKKTKQNKNIGVSQEEGLHRAGNATACWYRNPKSLDVEWMLSGTPDLCPTVKMVKAHAQLQVKYFLPSMDIFQCLESFFHCSPEGGGSH